MLITSDKKMREVAKFIRVEAGRRSIETGYDIKLIDQNSSLLPFFMVINLKAEFKKGSEVIFNQSICIFCFCSKIYKKRQNKIKIGIGLTLFVQEG